MSTLQFSEGDRLPPFSLPQKKQLLNNIVDGMAVTRPESVWAKVPRDEQGYDSGFRKITYRDMANAINGVAQWLVAELGSSTTFETLAYVGPWDPRYIFILLGAVKAGFKMVFPSSNYPAAGLSQLLNQLGCTKFLVASKQLPIVPQLLNHMTLGTYEIPSLAKLLDIEYPHFPFPKTFQSARSDPFLIIHTSGTTGAPKPLIITHDWVASWIQQNQWPAPSGYTSLEHVTHGIEIRAIGPPNHSSIFYPNLFGAVSGEMTVLYPIPDAHYTIETTMELIRRNDPCMLIAPSFILDKIASDDHLLKEVSSKVSMVGFGSGPLSQDTGDTLSQHFRLLDMYGTSEIGLVHKLASIGPRDAGAWNSIMPHPNDNIQFRQVGGTEDKKNVSESVYEAMVVRNTSPEQEQPVFKLFPHVQEWSTKDTFHPDPERPGFWVYAGRIDDVLILSYGQTVNPIGFEQKLSAHPSVAAAVMCGSGKPRPSLIVQMRYPQTSGDRSSLDVIWPAIEECNTMFPPQTGIERSHVLIAAEGKPLPKSAKGTVRRVAAAELYRDEVDGLY